MKSGTIIKFLTIVLALGLVDSGITGSAFIGANHAFAASAKQKKKQNIKKLKNLAAKKGLAAIPSTAAALKKGKTVKKTSKAVAMAVKAHSAPPLLTDIAQSDISSIFWAPGVVDAIASGSASQAQCGQFHDGGKNGESGGMGACHMAESVGFTFENMIQSETSLCYMKNFPSAANLAAGGVTLESGSFPEEDISKLFSPPAGSSARIVKVNVTGEPQGEGEEDSGGPQTIFIKVYAQDENKNQKNMYAVDLWFCGESGESNEYNLISISNSGKFEMEGSHQGGGDSSYNVVTGFLAPGSQEAAWDTTQKRTAFLYSQRDDGTFKANVEISGNQILVKQIDTFGGSGTQKAKIATVFSGSSPDTLRFIEGAFNISRGGGDGDDFKGGTKYGNSYYLSSDDTSVKGKVQSGGFSSDSFYTSISTDLPARSFSCATTPDIEITLDMSNATMQESVSECENQAFRGMHFCHDNELVRQADQNYGSVCSGPGEGGPGEGGPGEGGPGEGGPGDGGPGNGP